MRKNLFLKSTLSTLAFVIASALASSALADGSMSVDLQPWNGRFLMDAEHQGNTVKGSVSPAVLSPTIRLELKHADEWQGSLGQQVASAKIKDKGKGKYEITISALPGGWYSYTFVTKSNGDVEISGMGPHGTLNTAGVKHNGQEVYFSNIGFGVDFRADKAGHYSGTAGSGADSGNAYLKTSGDLDPRVLVQDPLLFTLLYVFPFSS